MLKLRPGSVLLPALLVLCIVASATTARAVFKVNKPAPVTPVQSFTPAPLDTPIIIETGKGVAEYRSSKGKNLPMGMALGMITPSGWEPGKFSKTGLMSKRVTWQSSHEPWNDTLRDLGRQNHMRFLINWDRKEVTVLPLAMAAKPVATPPAAAPVLAQTKPEPIPVQPVAQPAPDVTPATSQPEVSLEEYKKPSVKIVAWSLKAGSVRKQLESFSAANNWNMVWTSNLSDYIVPVSATFTGPFEQVVHEAFVVIRKTSDCGLKPKFYRGNFVVEVKDI